MRLGIILLLLIQPVAAASDGHADPVAPVVAALGVLLLAAKLGGEVAIRLKQPAVLGELVAGIALANVSFGGIAPFQPIASNETVEVLAGIGALILLFEVGLESTVRQMLQVGITSLIVAVLGVVVPFLLGWGVGKLFMPDASEYAHAFLGATLCATSVGITARVLKDLGASRSPEARIILGAAVIDDVLGLVILGAVSGAIVAAGQGLPFSPASIAETGIGMVPRGEVGLIFANVGAGLTLGGVPVIDPASFSAIVAMVVVTTILTPPALKWSLAGGSSSAKYERQ